MVFCGSCSLPWCDWHSPGQRTAQHDGASDRSESLITWFADAQLGRGTMKGTDVAHKAISSSSNCAIQYTLIWENAHVSYKYYFPINAIWPDSIQYSYISGYIFICSRTALHSKHILLITFIFCILSVNRQNIQWIAYLFGLTRFQMFLLWTNSWNDREMADCALLIVQIIS